MLFMQLIWFTFASEKYCNPGFYGSQSAFRENGPWRSVLLTEFFQENQTYPADFLRGTFVKESSNDSDNAFHDQRITVSTDVNNSVFTGKDDPQIGLTAGDFIDIMILIK